MMCVCACVYLRVRVCVSVCVRVYVNVNVFVSVSLCEFACYRQLRPVHNAHILYLLFVCIQYCFYVRLCMSPSPHLFLSPSPTLSLRLSL